MAARQRIDRTKLSLAAVVLGETQDDVAVELEPRFGGSVKSLAPRDDDGRAAQRLLRFREGGDVGVEQVSRAARRHVRQVFGEASLGLKHELAGLRLQDHEAQ